MAIRSYRDKRTADFVGGGRVPAFEACARQAAKAIMKLQAASRLIDLRNPPSNCFEALKGDRLGEYSIRITDRWRVCFKWSFVSEEEVALDALVRHGEPYDVEISDHYN